MLLNILSFPECLIVLYFYAICVNLRNQKLNKIKPEDQWSCKRSPDIWAYCKYKKKQILTSIKGRNSVANLRNTIIYNTNIDLVNDDVYTKFGLIL